MASTNLELVRWIFVAWERGDYSSAAWAHPQIEYVVADGPDRGSWKGLPAVTTAARERLRGWNNVRLEAEDFRVLDEDRILVLDRRSGRGQTSGLDTAAKGAHLFHLRDGKVTRLVAYWDRGRAFADLGLAASYPQSRPNDARSREGSCSRRSRP
jgi:ketosteroid isomerase-like protein